MKNSRYAEHFFAGVEAGASAWRAVGGHAIPSDRPGGSTPEGSAWWLGLCRGLEQMECTFGRTTPAIQSDPAPRLATTTPATRRPDGAAVPFGNKPAPVPFNSAAYLKQIKHSPD